eukprot:175048_1
MSSHQQLDGSDEPELVELHFELEIDYQHAFEPEQVITGCIAEVMQLNKNDIFFDGVDEIEKGSQYYGLFRGHIPTSKHEIESLVSIFYNSLQTNVLQQKIRDCSKVSGTPILEIRELYETDQNEEEQEEIDENYDQYNINVMQQTQQTNIINNQKQPMPYNTASMEVMLNDLKELLKQFITDTDLQFDQLLDNCQKQINEKF